MHMNHVSLTVADHDRSAAFYSRYFGMTERVHDEGNLLILGASDGALLALSTESAVPRNLPRTNHFGFRADDGDAVHAARKRFADDGITETEWQDDGKFVRVQVLDPDGYQVEIFSY